MSLVECVPNFSEGRRSEVVDAICHRIDSVSGVRRIDRSMDPDHNRAVLTLVGEPAAVGEAAFLAIEEAAERIDLGRHRGVHPRMGATDVCPFVPLEGTDMGVCIELAHRVGERVGSELAIPVFFYGAAARRPERSLLADVRRGGFEALGRSIGTDPARAPDAGPTSIHPTAGATAVGARDFLIAFNVELDTPDTSVARTIAGAIRERDGGLPGILALGFLLEGAGVAQVSTNVCRFREAGLLRVFEEIERLAVARGISVLESELVGLAPRAALSPEVARRIRLRGFDPKTHILEERIGT